MIVTAMDVACLQVIQASDKVDRAHYHVDNPPEAHPRQLLEEANFHLVDRNIAMSQIGFDYYTNIVTYRV